MKVYNVNVYTIHPYYTTINDKKTGIEYVLVKKIDKIMVTKNLFGVREVVTKKPLIVYDNNYIELNKKRKKYYLKHGVVLGINKSSLKAKNLVVTSELDRYKNKFVWSKFRKIIKIYDSQLVIDKRIEKIKRKIK